MDTRPLQAFLRKHLLVLIISAPMTSAFAAGGKPEIINETTDRDKRGFLCETPTNITLSSIDISSATVSFTSAGTSFIVEYGLPGFTPGIDANPGGGTVVTGSSSPVLITGLSAATGYEVYVRQECAGNEYSVNSTVASFTTLCAAASVPYFENFDGVSSPSVPACMTVENPNNDNAWRTVDWEYYYSAPAFMRLDYELDEVTAANDWFFTRGISLTAGTSYRLTFRYRNSDGTVYTEKLEVKYGTSPAASAMTAGTLFSNTNIDFNIWREAGIDFTPASSGVYYIGFHGFSDANNAYLAVDDVLVDATPGCPPPIGVSVTGVTSNSAIINFPVTGTNYLIEYGAPGFTPGTDALPGIGGTLIAVSSAQVPYTINGLPVSTTFDVYVRQNCTGPVYGPNSSKVSFTTTLNNDDAPGAIELTVGAGCTGEPYSNEGASQSEGEPYGSCSSTAGYATVWYKFVAPASGAVRVSTATGSGTNTLTDTRVAVFSATDVNNYTTFNIIGCDEDNGPAGQDLLSVLYATGLTPGTTYYVQVDVFDGEQTGGTFCLAVDELNSSMLATSASCEDGQTPFGSVASYNGWVSLVDSDSRLIALVRNPNGGAVDAYSVSQKINVGANRQDPVSNQYYLNRNFRIVNSTEPANIQVQLFFLHSELTSLQTSDAGVTLANLGATRQTGTICESDFNPINGTNNFLSQAANGTTADGLVHWLQVTNSLSGNYFLNASNLTLNVKAFLQGAFNTGLSRHKDVTTTWANVMNANALNQPYNTTAFGNYSGSESVAPGFFLSNSGVTTDITDWVLLEMKNASNVLVARRAALVREDGNIVDLDGVSPVMFRNLNGGTYYLTIRHRNHLGVSTQNLIGMDAFGLGQTQSSGVNFDFSTAPDTEIFGTTTAYKTLGARNVLIGGNANSNNNVRYGGPSNDPAPILVFVGGLPTGSVSNVYSNNDLNLDGAVRYGGPGNDPALVLSVLGGSPVGTLNEQKR